MAGPISHTAYAEKALETFAKGKDEKQFIIGNLFPDIRALKVIDRDSTHFTAITLRDIQQESDSFKAGMLFHSLIDTTREAFVLDHKAYADLPDSYLSTVALKLCEDIHLYSKVQNWQKYIDYLYTVESQERKFNIPMDKLQKWHTMHQDFFASSSLVENRNFFSSLGFSQEQIAEIFRLAEKITKNHVVDTYLDDFYDNLVKLLK